MTVRAKNIKAYGGWIKDAEPILNRNYRCLENHAAPLEKDRIDYFEDYRTRYFYDRFFPGQGAEEILDTLSEFSGTPKSWIDIGSGVTSLFWGLAINTSLLTEISTCDLVPEALFVLKNFIYDDEIPPCYTDALKLLNKPVLQVNTLRNLNWSFHIFDCLKPWPEIMLNTRHDLVTAIGCLGLSKTEDDYRTAFAAVANQIAEGGKIVGADWIRSSSFIKDEGHDNSYISAELIEFCGRKYGLQKLRVQTVPILDDDYYDSVTVWAFNKV
tara:strand:+ start:1271 stop:2080 length:810 start_codon:yes stop_codon:yes gene_type:complete